MIFSSPNYNYILTSITKQRKSKKHQNRNFKLELKIVVFFININLMMMMTIWWSEATRLLEFNRWKCARRRSHSWFRLNSVFFEAPCTKFYYLKFNRVDFLCHFRPYFTWWSWMWNSLVVWTSQTTHTIRKYLRDFKICI